MNDNWFAFWMRTQPKCPTPFQLAAFGQCVMPCPWDKKFVRRGGPEGFKCVYWPDEEYSVTLVTVGSTAFDGTTLEDLQRKNPDEAAGFTSEKARFEQEMTKVYANMDKQKKINDAFKDLQAAENVRDKSPEAYQTARSAYYTLLKGTDWIKEERERVATAEVAPTVKKYQDAVSAINVRKTEQQKTIDIVNGIKDKVLSLKDDFKYSVNTFSDQLEKVKIQINMENRSREKESDNTWAWVDMGLNVLLVAVLVYAVYSIGRQYYTAWYKPKTIIRIPTYTTPVV